MMRALLCAGLVLALAAPAEARRATFDVPAHGRVAKQVGVRPKGKPFVRWRVFVNGNELLVGDCFHRGRVCFLYGEGVVVRLTDPGRRVLIAVSSERARAVRVRAVFRFSR